MHTCCGVDRCDDRPGGGDHSSPRMERRTVDWRRFISPSFSCAGDKRASQPSTAPPLRSRGALGREGLGLEGLLGSGAGRGAGGGGGAEVCGARAGGAHAWFFCRRATE